MKQTLGEWMTKHEKLLQKRKQANKAAPGTCACREENEQDDNIQRANVQPVVSVNNMFTLMEIMVVENTVYAEFQQRLSGSLVLRHIDNYWVEVGEIRTLDISTKLTNKIKQFLCIGQIFRVDKHTKSFNVAGRDQFGEPVTETITQVYLTLTNEQGRALTFPINCY